MGRARCWIRKARSSPASMPAARRAAAARSMASAAPRCTATSLAPTRRRSRRSEAHGSRSMTTPKEIADAAEIALLIADRLVGYAKELQWLFAKAISIPRLALLDLEKIFAEIDKSLTAIDEATKVFFDAVENPERFIDD